jgi:hypothetical protein
VIERITLDRLVRGLDKIIATVKVGRRFTIVIVKTESGHICIVHADRSVKTGALLEIHGVTTIGKDALRALIAAETAALAELGEGVVE